MTELQPHCRWYRPTPDRLLPVLLAAEGFLFLSERFRWFAFNNHKGWTVLIAGAVVASALSLMAFWFAAAVLLRRRFQFSLCFLFVLTVVVAVPCAWLAAQMQQAERQRATVAALRRGGAVVYDYQRHESDVFVYEGRFGPFGQVWGDDDIGAEEFDAKFDPPAWPRSWLGKDFFQDVVAVDLPGGQDVGAQCELLKPLHQLEDLRVLSDKFTDADLEHLQGFSQLKALTLGCPAVTDAGLKHLAGLKSLKALGFVSVKITDAGLPRLEALENLEELYLADTKITDAGLEHLRRLTRLRRLYVGNPGVTEAGIKRLQQAMPKCVITPVDWERFGVDFDFNIDAGPPKK